MEGVLDAVVVFLFESYVFDDFAVFFFSGRQPVIHACVCAIPIFKVWQIFNFSARHLQSRVVDCVVVQCPVKIALLVLQRLSLLKEK